MCSASPGPHSIPLLAHARAGGPAAAAVFSHLDGLGDAGAPRTEPISDEEKPALVGTYVFGRGPADRIEISLDKGTLMLQRTGMPFGRGLTHLGNKTFHPAGAAAVTVATSGGATTLSVTDGDIVVTATRRT